MDFKVLQFEISRFCSLSRKLLQVLTPIMTVQEVGNFSEQARIENGAVCVWFEKNNPMEKIFDVACLKVFKPGPIRM